MIILIGISLENLIRSYFFGCSWYFTKKKCYEYIVITNTIYNLIFKIESHNCYIEMYRCITTVFYYKQYLFYKRLKFKF